MNDILTLTLNPALDITTSVEKLLPREKLRCTDPRLDPGGGGINVSRTVKELGGESTAFVLLCGRTGAHMRDLFEQTGIRTEVLEGTGETRISFRTYERSSGEQFRFVLPGPEQPDVVSERVLERLDRLIREHAFRYVVASGSLPPGLPVDLFAQVARLVGRHDAKLILDTSGAALEASLDAGVFLIKPDRAEARQLAQRDDDDPRRLAQSLLQRRAAEVIVLTLGGDGALVVSESTETHIRPPEVEVVSTAGAGDSFVGALTYALANDWSLIEACRYGVAAAAAAVLTEATELARRQDVDRLYEGLKKEANSSKRWWLPSWS